MEDYSNIWSEKFARGVVQKMFSLAKIVSCQEFHATYGTSDYTAFNTICRPNGTDHEYVFYGNINKSMQLNYDPAALYSGGIVSLFRKEALTNSNLLRGVDTFGTQYDPAIAGSQPPNGYDIRNHVLFGTVVSNIQVGVVVAGVTYCVPIGFNYDFDGYLLKIS